MLLPQSVTLSLSLPVCPPPSNSRCVRIPSLNRGSLPPSSQDQMISIPAARQCQQTSHPLHSCRSESPGAYQQGQSRYSKRLHRSRWRECRRLGPAFPGMNGRAVSVFIVAAPGAVVGQKTCLVRHGKSTLFPVGIEDETERRLMRCSDLDVRYAQAIHSLQRQSLPAQQRQSMLHTSSYRGLVQLRPFSKGSQTLA
jgi:hypothetical protein